MVVRRLAKAKVEGSNPFFRSIRLSVELTLRWVFLFILGIFVQNLFGCYLFLAVSLYIAHDNLFVVPTNVKWQRQWVAQTKPCLSHCKNLDILAKKNERHIKNDAK